MDTITIISCVALVVSAVWFALGTLAWVRAWKCLQAIREQNQGGGQGET